MPFAVLAVMALLQAATPADVEARNAPRVATADRLVVDHQPDQALAVIDTALADYDSVYRQEKRRIYCGMSPTETIAYMATAAKDKVNAVAVAPGYCTALYLRGFALVDLKRLPEARVAYERLVSLAPMHAHFITELGQLSRLERNWATMLETCERSLGYAELADDTSKPREKGFSLRCQGYALTEEHKLDQAEQRYNAALAIDPEDKISQNELKYIAQQRAKH